MALVHDALERGDFPELKKLLEKFKKEKDPDCDPNGWFTIDEISTAPIWSGLNSQASDEMIAYLLENGANPNNGMINKDPSEGEIKVSPLYMILEGGSSSMRSKAILLNKKGGIVSKTVNGKAEDVTDFKKLLEKWIKHGEKPDHSSSDED